MDYIKEMHSYCAAQESIFDKIRKSKMTSAEYKGIKTFSNVKEFVAEALQSDKKLKGTIRGLRIGLQIDRDVPVSEIEAICTNGLANMQKIHKAICMKIVNEFNDGTDKPWNWQKKVPNGKISLADIENEIQAEGCFISFYSNYTSMDCAFTDGPHYLYGGHSLVVYGKVPSNVFDAKGKWIGNPKTVDFSIEG